MDYKKIILYNEKIRNLGIYSEKELTKYIEKNKETSLIENFKENFKLKFKDYIITILGYTNTKRKHTNWFPWNRFLDVFKTIGYKCEWIEYNKLVRKNEKRIFITWNNPTSLELYKSNKVKEYDIVFQKLTSLGKGMEKINWTNNSFEWNKKWNWPIYKTVEYLYDNGMNIYGFGCKTNSNDFPEKKRICEKLKDRIFWITWGGTPFNWEEILNSSLKIDNLNDNISFVGSYWGKIGRGNIDAWKKYIVPLSNTNKFKKYGGPQNYITDEKMKEILKKSKLCPIIHAPSWQSERGIQDRFYTVFLSGRFGICDNLGAIDIFGEEIKEICETNPKKYYEKSLFFHSNYKEQRKYIEIIQKKIKKKYNFYVQWYNILSSDNLILKKGNIKIDEKFKYKYFFYY